jgi:hypothetical protein
LRSVINVSLDVEKEVWDIVVGVAYDRQTQALLDFLGKRGFKFGVQLASSKPWASQFDRRKSLNQTVSALYLHPLVFSKRFPTRDETIMMRGFKSVAKLFITASCANLLLLSSPSCTIS